MSRSWPAGLLLAYPPDWRARYGDELDSLVSDLHAGGRRAVPMAFDLLRGAIGAWLTPKRGLAMSERSRGALYAVLWNWVAFAATAAWFGHDLGPHDLGRFTSWVRPRTVVLLQPSVPSAYYVLLAAGVVGVAATIVAAVPFAIGAARYAHAHGQRRIYVLMAVPPVVVAAWIGGLQAIPGGPDSPGREGLAVLWLLLGVAGIAAATQAVITVARTCELSDRTWRIGGLMATVVTAAMVVATGATIAWGLLLPAAQPRIVATSSWLVVTVILAVTTARAVIALIGSRHAARSAIETPAPA